MEGAGIRKIHDLEDIASDQPPDRGKSCYKRDQRYGGEREWKAGDHNTGLYLPITFVGVTSGVENSTKSQNRIKLIYT